MDHVSAMIKEARTGYRSPRTGITDGCKIPCGCRELNPHSLNLSVLLAADSCLHHCTKSLNNEKIIMVAICVVLSWSMWSSKMVNFFL